MPKRLSDTLREYLLERQGKVVEINQVRNELRINPDSPSWVTLRKLMSDTMVREKILKPSGYKDGNYKVIVQVSPVKVYGRERREPVRINFPKDYNTSEELCFAANIVMREGDLILISGQSNYGKTCLCMNFIAENLDLNPILMGNEYTTVDKEPSSRFLSRLDNMDWVQWYNGSGEDRFTLLPVRDDYAEYIVKDRLNVIDWINLDELYLISKVQEEIKTALGNGNGVIAIQKAEGATAGRGGQFTKDFTDVEILLDKYTDSEVLMTLGKVKESTAKVSGRTFAFGIYQGVRIVNFREIVKCFECFGKGWKKIGNASKPCPTCLQTGYIDKE